MRWREANPYAQAVKISMKICNVICFDTHRRRVQHGAMDGGSRRTGGARRDSRGGSVPGLAGAAAWHLSEPEPAAVPVLIAVPHAGRAYPPELIGKMRDPALAALRLEDRYVDILARKVAEATGAGLLQAHAPRAMIDLNRAPEEVDWTMLEGGAQGQGRGRGRIARRARSGLGLVPRRLAGMGEIWRTPLPVAALDQRIGSVHAPYHDALDGALRSLHSRWGAALLVDFHSMPPLGRQGEAPGAELVIGDRFGASCDGGLVAAAFAEADRLGMRAAHNRPYAGGYVLDRHGRPARGRHAMQFEICRRAYLDMRLAEPGERLEDTASKLALVIRRLAAETAALGSATSLPEAAE